MLIYKNIYKTYLFGVIHISVFLPTIIVDSVLDINTQLLDKHNIKGIILDVDNTLTSHGNPIPSDGVVEWLDMLKHCGIKTMIVSNNVEKRVKPFAASLKLDYVSMGCKPLTFGITRACKKFGLKKEQIAIVGDQIFTDITAGNLKGITSFLVTPIKIENSKFFRFKRYFENIFINKYKRKYKDGRD